MNNRFPKQGVEEITIFSFAKPPEEDPEAVINEPMPLGIPSGSGPFALAALLKGFHEFYLKPLGTEGGEMPPEMVSTYEHNLEIWKNANQPKSKIIL